MEEKLCKQMGRFLAMAKESNYFLSLVDKSKQMYKLNINNTQEYDSYQIGQFHIKSSRAWHLYLSEFLHFCPIYMYNWDVVREILLFENLGKTPCQDENMPFWIYTFFDNFWSKGPIKLTFGTGKFFGMRSPKITHIFYFV